MTKKEHLDLTGPTNINLLEACIIGLVAAIGAVLLKDGVGFLGAWRIAGVDFANANLGQWHFLFLPVVGSLGGLVAGALIQFVAPAATGSGIPQVKAAIMGVPQDLGLRTAAVKLVSCVVALGSGLSMGREGPTVQLSAALSAKASELIRSSPKHRAQLIAAGAGAGLAAAFNAPLAGALFVLEELIGRISGFTVGTAVVACFMAAVLSRLVGVHSLDIEMSKLNGLSTFFPIDIPFYLLLGVAAGLLGALFNKSIIGGLTINRDFLKWPVTITCGLAGLISGILVASVPPLYNDYSGLREALVAGNLGLNAILLALVLQFVLTVVAYSSGAPGGLFAPSLTMGACLGLLVAFVEQQLCGSANSVTFAIVGMGAVFCAVARVPMTAVVIIFEMTTDFNVVLPLMICSVVSYLVAEKLDPGSIYDQLLEWGGIDSESVDRPSLLQTIAVGQVMERQVETLEQSATLGQIRAQFAASRHHGFPVLDQDKKVVGMLTEHDLLILNQEQEENLSAKKLMVPNPVTVDSEQVLAEAVLLFDNYKISRIPVVDDGCLVGIITREDVMAAESKGFLRPKRDLSATSFVTYETRSLTESRSRLLVILQEEGETERHALVALAATVAKAKSFDLECLHVQTTGLNSLEVQKDSNRARLFVQQAEAVANEMSVAVHTSVRLAQHQAIAVGEIIDRRPIAMIVVALDLATDLLELELIVKQTACPILGSCSSYGGNASAVTLTIFGLDPAQASLSKEIGQLFMQTSEAKLATLHENVIESEKVSKILESFKSANELAILALSRQNFIAAIKDAEVRELLKRQVPILFSVS
ncbi:chloride channel protein [bacterium]|nr:chloride channel protein [bacterium]MBP9807243.1 chloride channel protein [bacterium]